MQEQGVSTLLVPVFSTGKNTYQRIAGVATEDIICTCCTKYPMPDQ